MDFVNSTPYEADVFRTSFSEGVLQAAVVCKATYRIESDGTLTLDNEDPWPVGPDPVKTPYGEFDGELPFYRRGIDFIVVGTAHSPGGVPLPWLDVNVSVGSVLSRTVRVFGDRVWEDGPNGPVVSSPVPFERMPMTYERAFGGECDVDGRSVAFGANPAGMGYARSAEEALGKRLPNLEDPWAPIRAWSDQPDPVGLGPYPRDWLLRARNGIAMKKGDRGPEIKAILPTIHNNAHPRLIIGDPRALQAGDPIRITHVRPGPGDGALIFRLPETWLHVHVQIEERHFLFPMYAEQIIVLADDPRVVFSYRVCFRYSLIAHERRLVGLYEGRPPSSLPETYPTDPGRMQEVT